MAHKWTSSDEERLRELFGQGLTDEALSERLRDEGVVPTATARSVGQKALSIGLRRVGAPRLEPSVDFERVLPRSVAEADDRIPAGIKGGERFQRVAVPVKDGDRILVMGDTQFPYQDAKTLTALERFVYDYEPHVIIWDGDMYDFYPLSKYDQSPGRASNLQHELDIGQKIQERWANRFPNSERILIEGNHEDRLRKYVWEHSGIASLRGLDPTSLLSAGGSWRVLPYGSQVRINDLIIEHGEAVRSKSAMTAWAMYTKRGMSGICGHTHRFGVISNRTARGQHIYIENGCLCRLDPEYGAFPDWTQGFTYGYINNGSIHLSPTRILDDGFRAEGRFYRRER